MYIYSDSDFLIPLIVILSIAFVIVVVFTIAVSKKRNEIVKKRKQLEAASDYSFLNVNESETGKRKFRYNIKGFVKEGTRTIKIVIEPEIQIRDIRDPLSAGVKLATITLKGANTGKEESQQFTHPANEQLLNTAYDVNVSEELAQEDINVTVVTHWKFGLAEFDETLTFTYEVGAWPNA